MGAMTIKKGSCMPSGKIAYHYHLRYSYQLHGSVMATKSFLSFFEFARFFFKRFISLYTQHLCGYVCFSSSRFFFTERNRIHHTSPQM